MNVGYLLCQRPVLLRVALLTKYLKKDNGPSKTAWRSSRSLTYHIFEYRRDLKTHEATRYILLSLLSLKYPVSCGRRPYLIVHT